MSWSFYTKEGKLLYDVVAGSVGDADTLDGIDSTGFVKIGAPGLNSGDVDIDGSLTLPVLNGVTANVTLTNLDRTVLVDTETLTTPITVTLPASPLTGQIYEIKDRGASGTGWAHIDDITINGNGNNIEGAATYTINQQAQGIVIVFNGTSWHILSDIVPASVGSINADTLDGLDSLQFLRSDVDDTAAGNITFSKSAYSPVDTVDDTTNPNTLSDQYRTVVADSVTNLSPVTVTLPNPAVLGQWYEVTDGFGGATANNITVSRNGGTINNVSADVVMDTDYDSVVLACTSGGVNPNWAIISHRFPPSGPVAIGLDDLTDVDTTTTPPTEGELLRYDTPANLWVNTPDATVSDLGRLHLKEFGASTGIRLGENAGVGKEVDIYHIADNTVEVLGRARVNGTSNSVLRILENGVTPAGDTYDVDLPVDSVLLANTTTGDLFVRLPDTMNSTSAPMSGDMIVLKDATGDAPLNAFAFVGEGVRRRNLPQLTLDSPTGTIADATTTTTPGGVGVDEVQNFQVTGTGTYNINFDGAITAGLTELSTGAQVQTAINNLSPHPNYGHFSVTVTGATAAGGLSIAFNGGSIIDGEAYYYLTVPWQSTTVVFRSTANGGEWLVL